MAENKNTSKKTTKRRVVHRETVDIVKLCAFWGIFIAAVLFVAYGILSLFNMSGVGGTIMSILDLLGKLALLVAVAFPAYNYVRGKAKVWKIIFWAALVVYIAGCVLGLIKL